MAKKLNALGWLQDALDCTTGEHGDWWRDRYERAMEDGMDHWWQWRDIRQNERPPVEVAGLAAKLAECGYVPLAFLNDGWFTWLCPGCGYFSHGRVGEQPVGGWNEPRWTVTGLLPDHLTLQPSLGCPRWRDGTCTGHWWCRDGELVSAEVTNGG